MSFDLITAAHWVFGISVATAVYAYIAYPLALWLLASMRARRAQPGQGDDWPLVSFSLPAYNEEASIAATLERILAVDYPADRRQVLVVSDASTDRTDEIVRGFRDRGVELLRVPERRGKTAAENAAGPHLRGEIVVNTDASVRIHPDGLKPLIRQFADPAVGLASGRDVSVARIEHDVNMGESGYVGYEMWVRALETRVGSIVGASGCFYAIRRALHMTLVPEALSRDFAAALIAREHGLRAVSVSEAVCFVPRIASIRREYRRKVRTMTRGLETLWFKRHLLNPFTQGLFAWSLLSHKLARWLVPWALAAAGLALLALAPGELWAAVALAGGLVVLALGALGWWWPEDRPALRLTAVCAYFVSGMLAAIVAWGKALSGEMNPVWEPTRREQSPRQA
jgi:cellulose synthase/poly-beta-1,6-N-acetylglucosamine synthase-like glycosyltransferase